MEGEVSILLVVTVIIGTILMSSLLVCYICVFRQLCCSSDLDGRNGGGGGRGGSGYGNNCGQHGSKRNYNLNRGDSVNMNELTHVSSQPTETDRI